MASTTYKLIYFNVLGRGEPIRMLLSYGGLDFEDKRIDRANWELIKPTIPYGQLPVLEINGKIVTQTIPICRYLANVVNLAGKDKEENLKIDAVVEAVFDTLIAAYGFYMETAEERKKNLKKKFDQILLTFLPILDENVNINGGYIALDRITWADVIFLSVYEDIRNLLEGEDFLTDYPNLQQVNRNLLKVTNLKDWIKKRPVISTNKYDLRMEI